MGDIVNAVAAVADVFGFGPASKQADATEAAAGQSAAASRYAADVQREMFNKQIELQEPWRQAGVNALARMQSGEYALPGAFSYDPNKLTFDPGYQFRLKEGMNALNRTAAARGGLISGAALKAATRYGQDMGSQEFQNAYDRALTEYNSRLKNSEMGYNRLAGLSGTAQTISGELGKAGQTYGSNIGNLAMTNATNQGNALLAGGNIRASQYGNYGRALDQALNTDWGKVSDTIGGWFGGGSAPAAESEAVWI